MGLVKFFVKAAIGAGRRRDSAAEEMQALDGKALI